jgi:hypothetical protein
MERRSPRELDKKTRKQPHAQYKSAQIIEEFRTPLRDPRERRRFDSSGKTARAADANGRRRASAIERLAAWGPTPAAG